MLGAGIYVWGIYLNAWGEEVIFEVHAQSNDNRYSPHRERLCVLEPGVNKQL